MLELESSLEIKWSKTHSMRKDTLDREIQWFTQCHTAGRGWTQCHIASGVQSS